MSSESTLSIKDFFPVFGTILAIIAGYIGISRQVNKNRKAKWVEDFRREIANFFGLAVIYKSDDEETIKKIAFSAFALQLYLDLNDDMHKRLSDEVGLILTAIAEKSFRSHFPQHRDKFTSVLNLAHEIIQREQSKI